MNHIDSTAAGRFGFTVIRDVFVPEIDGTALLLRHDRSGAQLLSLHTPNTNKVFGITFRTVPENSKGVPHILEHSVLSGSERYPVKEPFVELLKGSMQTFLNALTYSDKTCYPVASPHEGDFFNLVRVYLDAVFFPLLAKETFEREGWHLEVKSSDTGESLVYQGVVFNEMKGAYSSPDTILRDRVQQLLYPDIPYQHSSGGNPRNIPDLTYEEFLAFHREHYHPSNALLYFFGDNALDGRLEVAAEYLDRFSARAASSPVPLQQPIGTPRADTVLYDAGDDAGAGRGIVSVSWLLPEGNDPVLVLSLLVLDYLLLGTPASPLYKRLVDAGLADQVMKDGVSTSLRQMAFSVGLRNVLAGMESQAALFITQSLAEIQQQGFSQESIDAALHSLEFHLREQSGDDLLGLELLFHILERWLHGEDPIQWLQYESAIEAVRRQASVPGFFEGLLQRYVVDNQDRVTVTLLPQPGIAKQVQLEEAAVLAGIKSSLTPAELQAVRDNAERLERLRSLPDSDAARASIPVLPVSQLGRFPTPLSCLPCSVDGIPAIVSEEQTHGIVYVDVALSLASLTVDEIRYVPLLCQAINTLGTVAHDVETLSILVDSKTGGISASPWVLPRCDGTGARSFLLLQGKAMQSNKEDLLRLMSEMLVGIKLDQPEKVLRTVRHLRAKTESDIMVKGHRFVEQRIAAQHSVAGLLTEAIEGFEQLLFLRALETRISSDWPGVLSDLSRICGQILIREGSILHVVCDSSDTAGTLQSLKTFVDTLPTNACVGEPTWTAPRTPVQIGYAVPSLVNYSPCE